MRLLLVFRTGAAFVALVGALACSKRVPKDLQAMVDAQRAAAVKAADDAAAACPAFKPHAPFQANPAAAPKPATPNPAKGTSLESEAAVRNVIVMCSWADPRDPKSGTWAGTSMPALKGAAGIPKLKVTMPEDMAVNTCKDNASNCEQLVAPSRYEGSERSADLRIVRPTPDGGRAELTVIFALP